MMIMSPKGFALLPGMMILVCLLCGLVFLIIKKPKIILPIILIAFVLFSVLMLSFRNVQTPVARIAPPVSRIVPPNADAISMVATVPARETSMNLPDIWKPGIEVEFDVTKYTSIEAAAAGLAKKIALEGYLNDAIDNNEPDGVNILTDIQICSDINSGIANKMTVLDAAADSFRKYAVTAMDIEQTNFVNEPGTNTPEIEPVKVTVSPAMPSNPLWGAKKGAVLVKITARIDNSDQSGIILTRNGILSMQVQSNKYRLDNSVAYTEANWLVLPEQYSHDSRSNDTWLVGYSQSACSDPAESRNQAVADAAARLAHTFGSSVNLTSSDLSNLDIIKDTFTQKLKGSQGDIYRTAILVSGSTSKIGSYLADMQHSHQAVVVTHQVEKRNSILFDWASVAILLGAILLSFFLLDFITKGYYKGRLVMVLILIALLGVAVIIFLSNQRQIVMGQKNTNTVQAYGGDHEDVYHVEY